jgi:hypothetical protein
VNRQGSNGGRRSPSPPSFPAVTGSGACADSTLGHRRVWTAPGSSACRIPQAGPASILLPPVPGVERASRCAFGVLCLWAAGPVQTLRHNPRRDHAGWNAGLYQGGVSGCRGPSPKGRLQPSGEAACAGAPGASSGESAAVSAGGNAAKLELRPSVRGGGPAGLGLRPSVRGGGPAGCGLLPSVRWADVAGCWARLRVGGYR